MPNARYLASPGTDVLHAALAASDRIGIDTEFMRENTFFAELCLLQVAIADDIYLIDPLEAGEVEPLWGELLASHWVVHSGRQDIEVVFQTTGKMPRAVFDTQVAAGLLGYPPQLGYGNLVSELFGVELSKSQTRADWRQRPLSTGMLSYAAEDVEFLLDAEITLRERLAALGRERWAEEDSARLLESKLYSIDAAAAFSRLKGARNLRGRARRAARGLAAWREQRALARNRPRQWILKDALLLEIARRGPQSIDDLAHIDGVPPAVVRRAGAEILDMLKDAAGDVDSDRPPAAPTEGERATLNAMQRSVAAAADELGLATEVLAPRRELAAALRGDRDCRVFSGWRRDLVGQRLLDMLQ